MILPDSDVGLEMKIFNSGWVTTKKSMILSGAPGETIRVPALFAMFKHPEHGVILYDTGYHTRFFEATANFPWSILKKFTPAAITEDDNAVRQLEREGVNADDVKTIIIGHGHVDHIPGAPDFPKAKILIDRREWAYMQGSALAIFSKGYLKSFYEDLPNEIEKLDFAVKGTRIGPFSRAIDLWGDSSMILVPLEGHTIGQMGLLAHVGDGRRYLFIGDAAWISENYLEEKPPSLLARIILSSYRDFKATLKLLNDFHRDYPDVGIVPCHCPGVYENLKKEGVAV